MGSRGAAGSISHWGQSVPVEGWESLTSPPLHSHLSLLSLPLLHKECPAHFRRAMAAPCSQRNPHLRVREKLSGALEGSRASIAQKGGSWWIPENTQKPASLPEVQNVQPHTTLTRDKGDKWTHTFQKKKPRPSKGEQTFSQGTIFLEAIEGLKLPL